MSKRNDHNWEPIMAPKLSHWLHCTRCGMVWLNNAISRKAAKKACPGVED